jgi:hypothetical protein
VRETRRGRPRSASAQRKAADLQSPVTPPDVPSLAELRRRATHRLREIAAHLENVRQEHARAAAECARLQAANGALPPGEPLPAPPPETQDRPAPTETPRDAANSDAEAEREGPRAFENRIAELEALTERERTSKAELERRLSALESDLERERSAHRIVADERDRLKAGLRHAEGRLAAQSQRAEALEARAEQLQAELETARQPPEPAGSSRDDWQQRVLQLQLDLRGALEDKFEACEKLDSLLRFLDELNGVLAAPGIGLG